MVYSRAYQDLNAPTLKLLSYFLLQLRWVKAGRKNNKYVVSNKDEIKMLYSTFKTKPFNMNPNTIRRSIDALLAHGFMKVIKQGGKVKGQESIYGYSERWQKWNSGEVIFTRRPFAPRGFTLKRVVNI